MALECSKVFKVYSLSVRVTWFFVIIVFIYFYFLQNEMDLVCLSFPLCGLCQNSLLQCLG
jgi:hypothetical protein